MKSVNPWVERFARINSLEIIEKLSARPAQPLINLHNDSTEVACNRMAEELREVFIPTKRTCAILQKWVQRALGHAMRFYPNTMAFKARCYELHLDVEPCMPIVLTGPAGTGKSQLCKAFMRLLGPESKVELDTDHTPFPLISARRVAIQNKKSINDILLSLVSALESQDAPISGKGNRLLQSIIRYQYRSGVCLLMADELQFLTQSSKANALLASVILQLTYIGIPIVLVGNYSLLHRLLARPQEEKQRMLGDLILLLPDPPFSEDWEKILKEYQRALPGIFQFNFVDKRQELWRLCAGLKRELVKLLIVGYRQCRHKEKNAVSWMDLELAFDSFEFSAQRMDIKVLISQAVEGKKPRDDLLCPLFLPKDITQEYIQALEDIRMANLAENVAQKSMTREERKMIEAVEAKLNTDNIRKKAPVVPLKQKRTQLNAESLIAAGHLVNENLDKR